MRKTTMTTEERREKHLAKARKSFAKSNEKRKAKKLAALARAEKELD